MEKKELFLPAASHLSNEGEAALMIRLIRGSVERTALVKRRQRNVDMRVEPNEMKARQRLYKVLDTQIN